MLAGPVGDYFSGGIRPLTIVVEDNGKGLPQTEERHRLTEPYVTTRAKGTGLGLAIVRKIVEEHGARVELQNVETGGALVSITFFRLARA